MRRAMWMWALLSGCGADQAMTAGPGADGAAVVDAAMGHDAAPPVASGCVNDVTAGAHVYDCDGIKYAVAVPDQCVRSACGLIVGTGDTWPGQEAQGGSTTRRADRATTARGPLPMTPMASRCPST